MKKESVIREYRAEDQEHLKQCIIALQDFERELEPDRLEGASMVERNFREMMEEQRENKSAIFVAEVEQKVVGFIRVEFEQENEGISRFVHSAYIADLVVLQSYRGRGLGMALLRKAEAFARQSDRQVLTIGVLVKNEAATDVYLHAGFRPYELTLLKELS